MKLNYHNIFSVFTLVSQSLKKVAAALKINSVQHTRRATELLIKLVKAWCKLPNISMCGSIYMWLELCLTFNETTSLGKELALLV